MVKSYIQKISLSVLKFALNLLLGVSIGVFVYSLFEYIDMLTSQAGYSSSRSETILLFGIPAIIIAAIIIVLKRVICARWQKKNKNMQN